MEMKRKHFQHFLNSRIGKGATKAVAPSSSQLRPRQVLSLAALSCWHVRIAHA